MASVHPPREYLTAYASGSLEPGMSLLVAAHMTYCPECRRTVDALDAVSGALFTLAEQEVNDGFSDAAADAGPSLDAALAALDSDVAEMPAPIAAPGSPLPRPILGVAGADVDVLKWRFRMPGLHEHPLPGFEGENVSLLRVRPGTGMMEHTHAGEEATLILSGEMQDGDQVFRRGDVSFADHTHDHSPKVIGSEVCYCLIVMSGPVRFTGTVGRALNIFAS